MTPVWWAKSAMEVVRHGRACAMRLSRPVFAGLFFLLSGCSDLTEPLPDIAGTYDYVMLGEVPVLQRQGTITIQDFDRRSARFEGTFQYVSAGNQHTGALVGAFMQRDRIWFRFLDEPRLYHEGRFQAGESAGDVFFLGLVYEPTGATFWLRTR